MKGGAMAKSGTRRASWLAVGLILLAGVASVAGAAPVGNPVAALEKRLASASEKDQIGILNELGALLARPDPKRAEELGQRALALAERHRDVRGQALAHKNLGLALLVLERSADGLPHMQRATELFAGLGDRPEQARTLGYCGMLLSELGRLWPAVDAVQGALAVFRELGDAKGMAAANNNLGVLFNTLGDYQKALEFNLEALRLEESLGRKIGIANNLNSVGNIYSQLGDHLKARGYYTRALPLYEELGEKAGAAKVLNNVGNTYEKVGLDDEALKYFERSLAIGRQVEVRAVEAEALNDIGIVFKKRRRYDEALRRYLRVVELEKEIGAVAELAGTYHNIAEIHLLKERPDEALAYLSKALAIGQETKSQETLDTVRRLMAQCYEAKGDYRKAYENEVLSSEARAAMLDQQRSRKIAELQEKYDADARKRQIELLSKDNELLKKDGEIRRLALSRTRLVAGLLLALSALAAAAVLLFFRRFRYLITFWKKRSYVGHYRIVDTIASGGMGVVYRAVDLSQGSRPFAVKVIREELSSDPAVRQRFVNEAAIVDQLHHPNIIRIFERGEHDGKLFIAMELLNGPSLADVIRRGEVVSVPDCVDIMSQLADALAKIHSKGIVHRDLKPENVVLVEADGRRNVVKLLDFGLATTHSLTRLTQTGMILGTISYLSPEQITDRSVTAASDLYSLGVVAYELLTFQKPFPGETPADIIKQILDREPSAPVGLRLDIPGRLNGLILEMLSKDPAKRPDDASLVARLEELRRTRPADA
jgi:tetratricopeptide (TPR) repeat protein